MLKVQIKTSYSEEEFIIPDWQPDYDTDYYGNKFYCVENYADFFLCGELCFCDAFDILEISEATQDEIEAYELSREVDLEEKYRYRFNPLRM